jgi:23S rRNA G2069 N7-methylase RlmK/C1962 C5-methylase RlmI
LYDGDIKEVPLTVDLYGDRILLRTAPGRFTKRSVAEEADWLEAMAAAAAAALGIEEGNVVRRTRHRKDVILSVLESGLDYEVHLQTEADETGTGTGLPIPERSLRELVRALSPGKRVLIPFARSGALTVAAAAGGARSTTSIERSKEHLEWARRNLERNGLKRDTNTLTRADVYEVLRHYEASFDLLAVVLPRALSEASRADLFGGLRLACAPQATIVIASADSRVGLRDGDFPDFESVELTTTLLTEDVRRKRLRAWRLEKRADSRVVK